MLSEQPAASRSRADTLYDAPNLSPSLIPFVQLAALRCDASKAMLNVIDRETMYFLAQVSKRSVDGPKNMPMFETSEDSVLMGCSKVPVSGRVCELTIRMHADDTCNVPIFLVPDMSNDPRFCDLDVVKGGPQFKFYAGTPVKTRDGVNIGSLAIMDTRPRASLSADEERCLGETAAHVMKYLDLHREAMEGRQARRMGHALNSFVSGEKSLHNSFDASSPDARKPVEASSYGLAENLNNEKKTSFELSQTSSEKCQIYERK